MAGGRARLFHFLGEGGEYGGSPVSKACGRGAIQGDGGKGRGGGGEWKHPFLYFRPHSSGARASIMLTIRTTKVYFENDLRGTAGRGRQRPRTWLLNIQSLKIAPDGQIFGTAVSSSHAAAAPDGTHSEFYART